MDNTDYNEYSDLEEAADILRQEQMRDRLEKRRVKAGAARIEPIAPSTLAGKLPMARPWVYGTELAKGVVSICGGTGGSAKSTKALTMAVAMASGRDLLDEHDTPEITRRRVLLINNEDEMNELHLRLAGVCQAFGLDMTSLDGWLHLLSGVEGNIKIAALSGDDIVETLANISLEEYLMEHGIEVLIVDPLVSLHDCNENDNTGMNAVMGIIKKLAVDASVAVLLVHHAKKGGGTDADENLRGASAIKDAARCLVRLGRMTPDQAEELGIPDEQRSWYVGQTDGKHNYSAATTAVKWFKIETIRLAAVNEDGEPTSEVVAVLLPVDLAAEAPPEKEKIKKLSSKAGPVAFFTRIEAALQECGGRAEYMGMKEQLCELCGCSEATLNKIVRGIERGRRHSVLIRQGVRCWLSESDCGKVLFLNREEE